MDKLCLIFRKSRPGFYSIEKIFNQVSGLLGKEFEVEQVQMPEYRVTPYTILKNILFGRKLKGSIYHVTGEVQYAVLGLPGEKTILTIHDSVFMYKEKGIKKWFLLQLFLKLPVKHCTHITTISEASKRDIIRFTRCSPEKITVIPNPVDDKICYTQKTFRSEKPVILFLGKTPNKNLPRVSQALKGICCRLEIIGQIDADQEQLLKEMGIDFGYSFDLDSLALARKYEQADLVLFPSLFEGFGLPIVEANKAGRPVITSNLSPMKEVAGEAACLVDPYSVDSIRNGILRIINDEHYRDELVRKGFENIRKYQPQEVVNQYASLYRRVLRPFESYSGENIPKVEGIKSNI